MDEFTLFNDQKKIEHDSKKHIENIEKMKKNQIKSLQEKYNAISLEKDLEPIQNKDSVEIRSIKELIKKSKGKNISKNMFKRFLKNSFSSINNKNKAEFNKVYKKLYTPGIRNSPIRIQELQQKLQELTEKYKLIEEKKVRKENRTTNKLPTPELPKDTPSFFQKFKPKPEISPWAKKNNTVKTTKPTKPTSPKVKEGKHSTNQPVQSSYQLEDNSGFKRVPTGNEKKIIKLIKKLPSKTIKIADIKSAISSIKNNEIKKQLRSLLDQKLI
jgi:hypothetical protein